MPALNCITPDRHTRPKRAASKEPERADEGASPSTMAETPAASSAGNGATKEDIDDWLKDLQRDMVRHCGETIRASTAQLQTSFFDTISKASRKLDERVDRRCAAIEADATSLQESQSKIERDQREMAQQLAKRTGLEERAWRRASAFVIDAWPVEWGQALPASRRRVGPGFASYLGENAA